MTKLNILTKKQKKQIPIIRDKWIKKALHSEMDINKATEMTKWLYEFCNLEEPTIINLDSPYAIQLAANILNKNAGNVGEQVREKVWEQVREKVRDQVGDQVWEQVGEKVKEQVREKVKEQVRDQVGEQYLEFYPFSSNSLSDDAGWGSFYDFFTNIKIINNKKFNKYLDYLNSGIFMSIQLKKLCLNCKSPSFINRDEKNRLHCITDYALHWDDGYGQHYVHGVFFSPKLFQQFFINKKFKGEDIIKLKNTEQKTAIIQHYGYESIIKSIPNLKTIDTKTVRSKVTNKNTNYQLLEFDLDGQQCRIIKVECHTEHKPTFLGIPIEKQTETCMGAIAWTFGINTDDYLLEMET